MFRDLNSGTLAEERTTSSGGFGDKGMFRFSLGGGFGEIGGSPGREVFSRAEGDESWRRSLGQGGAHQRLGVQDTVEERAWDVLLERPKKMTPKQRGGTEKNRAFGFKKEMHMRMELGLLNADPAAEEVMGVKTHVADVVSGKQKKEKEASLSPAANKLMHGTDLSDDERRTYVSRLDKAEEEKMRKIYEAIKKPVDERRRKEIFGKWSEHEVGLCLCIYEKDLHKCPGAVECMIYAHEVFRKKMGSILNFPLRNRLITHLSKCEDFYKIPEAMMDWEGGKSREEIMNMFGDSSDETLVKMNPEFESNFIQSTHVSGTLIGLINMGAHDCVIRFLERHRNEVLKARGIGQVLHTLIWRLPRAIGADFVEDFLMNARAQEVHMEELLLPFITLTRMGKRKWMEKFFRTHHFSQKSFETLEQVLLEVLEGRHPKELKTYLQDTKYESIHLDGAGKENQKKELKLTSTPAQEADAMKGELARYCEIFVRAGHKDKAERLLAKNEKMITASDGIGGLLGSFVDNKSQDLAKFIAMKEGAGLAKHKDVFVFLRALIENNETEVVFVKDFVEENLESLMCFAVAGEFFAFVRDETTESEWGEEMFLQHKARFEN